jgi:hypothetical protein
MERLTHTGSIRGRNTMTIDREGIIRMFILDIVSDDYESVEIISKGLRELEQSCPFKSDFSDLQRAITRLIERGWLRAYDLRPQRTSIHIEGVPPSEFMSDYYYYPTEEGKKIHELEVNWPLDENGALKAGWSSPA